MDSVYKFSAFAFLSLGMIGNASEKDALPILDSSIVVNPIYGNAISEEELREYMGEIGDEIMPMGKRDTFLRKKQQKLLKNVW